jgi:signal transduction histidine kinase
MIETLTQNSSVAYKEHVLPQRTEVIARLWQDALTTIEVSSLLDDVVKLLVDTLDVECCYVLDLQPDGMTLKFRSGIGCRTYRQQTGTDTAVSNSLEAYALLTKEPVMTEDLRADPRVRGAMLAYEPALVSGLCVLIDSPRRPFGVLVAGNFDRHIFQPDDLDFLEEIAHVLALALVRRSADEAQATVEAQRQANAMKSAFLAMISHDLRTPLHHIKGYASALLRRRQEFEEAAIDDYLRIICDESDRLAAFVQDLLSTAQLESGSLQLEIESMQLDELLQATLKHWLRNESHQFILTLPDHVPPIPADARRIQQVLENLIANVVRHTPPETVTAITLEVTRSEVIVSFRDNGPGIEVEHLPFLFNSFYRAGASHDGGTGLGLYICKGIVEFHGGRIWVETTPRVGTTFRFSLPRRASAHRQPMHQASGTTRRPSHGSE